MLNKEQQRVYDWLNGDLSLPVFAEAYKGAVILIEQKQAGYVWFVAHAGRELINGLAPNVRGINRQQVQYNQLVGNLQAIWLDEWRSRDDLSAEVVESGHVIPIEVCQSISTLIDEHKAGKMRSSGAASLFFSTFLDYSDKDKIPASFLSEWKAAKDWFNSHGHLRDTPFRTKTDNDLIKHFNCLHGYLYIAASSQYERLKDLNEILDATNQ